MEWISVEDRLPESLGEMLLVIDSNKNVETYYYEPSVWSAWRITHWMPLPEPPKD